MDPALTIKEYLAKGILVDTNLMVLLIIGLYNRNRISSFKRTIHYSVADFLLLIRIINRFERRITTPHILAEVDNLTRQLPSREYGRLAGIMTSLIDDFFEIYSPSIAATHHQYYSKLGLTDCATLAAANDVLVITDDFPLSNILSYLGRKVINLNHIRMLGWT